MGTSFWGLTLFLQATLDTALVRFVEILLFPGKNIFRTSYSILQSSNPPIPQSSNPPIPDKPPGIFCPLSFFIFQPPNIFNHGFFTLPNHFKSFLAVLLTVLTVLSLPAQQLYCGNSPLTTCSGSIGIGAANNGILGAPIGLTIEHTASSGGGLYVNATTPNGFGILTGSQSGTGLMSTTSSGVAISALASSSSGKALYGETTTGTAVYGRSTQLGGRAGVFDGKVDFLDDAEVQGSLQVDQNLDAQNLTIEAPAAHAFGVAHFKAGPDRQLFVAPNLGSGSFNHLSQAGDLGVIFSDGLASGNQNQSAGLVLAPWTGGWARGIRIDADGKVGIGTATPQAELDVEGDVRVEEKLSVPKLIGEQNGNTPTQICAHTTSDDGSCISLWGNGSTTRPGHISLVASNGTGSNGGEIRFLQNTGSGTFVQHMVVTADGELGIGLATPEAPCT
jgi:hypothetical protein